MEGPILQGLDVDDAESNHAESRSSNGLAVDGVLIPRERLGLLFLHLLQWCQIEHGLVFSDVILDVMWHVLTSGLESVHLDMNLKVEIQIPEIDQIGEDEFALGDALTRAQHLSGNHSALVFDEDNKIVNGVVPTLSQHFDELGLERQCQSRDGDLTLGTGCPRLLGRTR